MTQPSQERLELRGVLKRLTRNELFMTIANPHYPLDRIPIRLSLTLVSETWNAQGGPIQSGMPTVFYGSEDRYFQSRSVHMNIDKNPAFKEPGGILAQLWWYLQ